MNFAFFVGVDKSKLVKKNARAQGPGVPIVEKSFRFTGTEVDTS